MTADWPELRPDPEAVAVDSDDPTVVARAVWLAIVDDKPLVLVHNTFYRRHLVGLLAQRQGHTPHWMWAAAPRDAYCTFTEIRETP